MKAFILAAGRGERMRPLTRRIPKPLVDVDGKTLIDYQISKLVASGFKEIIINTAYLGEMLHEHIGSGEQYGANITFSVEKHPLETAGAIYRALDLIGDQPFLLVNGDIWMEYDYRGLLNTELQPGGGHLVLVNNPKHKHLGDFCINGSTLASFDTSSVNFTYSGVSLLSPALIANYPNVREVFPLKEVFDWGISQRKLSAEIFDGFWLDVGTPQRLQRLKDHLISRNSKTL